MTEHQRPRAASGLDRPLRLHRLQVRRPPPTRRPAPAGDLASAAVLVVGCDYPPTPSRIAPQTADLATHLSAVTGGVTVLAAADPPASGPGPPRRTLEVDGGLSVVRYRLRRPDRFRGSALARYETAFLLAVSRVDLPPPGAPRWHAVIGVTPAVSGAVAATRLAERAGARLLLVVHDLVSGPGDEWGATVEEGALGRVLRHAEQRALRRAETVVAVHEHLRAPLIAAGVPPHQVCVPAPGDAVGLLVEAVLRGGVGGGW